MKIALSASGYNHPAVMEVLAECDMIFTTNYRAIPALEDHFPSAQVRGIPDATDETYNWLRSRWPEAEFVGFSDLFKLRSES